MTECEREVQTVVLGVDGIVVQCQLETRVLGLAHVLVLCVVAATCDLHLHEQVFHVVLVHLERTVELVVEETEVNTQVERVCGFPLQVGVAHCVTRGEP